MTDLTDRMRTCAEFLQACDLLGDLEARHDVAEHAAVCSAIELLREAATELEKPIEVRLGEPMSVIEAVTVPIPPMTPQWTGGDLKVFPNVPLGKSACPNCDSRTTKTVHVKERKIVLECPVCGHMWKR